MTGVEIALIVLCAAAGATVQGSIGIGYALVAAPGLVAIDPSFAPGPLLMIGQVVGARHILAERDHIDLGAFRHCLYGLPLGVVAGIAVLEALDQRMMAILVGVATALAALAMLCGFSLRRSKPVEIGAGFATAFASATAGLPGPPLVTAFSDMRPATLRATASAFIGTIAVIVFLSLLVTGNFGGDEFRLLLLLVPGTLAGLLASRFVRPHLERPVFRPLILSMALIGGIALVLRTI